MVYSINRERLIHYVNNLTIFLYFLLQMMYSFTGVKFFNIAMFIIIPVFFFQMHKSDLNSIFECLFLFMLYIFLIIVNQHTENMSWGWLFDFQYIFAILLISQKQIDSKVFFILIALYFILIIKDVKLGVDVNRLLATGSRNMISAFSINISLLYYFLSYIQKKIPSILPAVLNLILCFISIGRSGIIIGLIIMCSVFLFIFYNSNRKKRTILLFVFIITLILGVRVMNFKIFDLFSRFNEKGIVSNARERLINEYFNEINTSLDSFLFGVKLRCNDLFVSYNLNVHNSFLSLHCNYGLLGFLIAMVFIILSIILLFFSKQYFLLILLGASLLRVYVDTIAFPGYFDIVVFSICFYSFRHYGKRRYFLKVSPMNKDLKGGIDEKSINCS